MPRTSTSYGSTSSPPASSTPTLLPSSPNDRQPPHDDPSDDHAQSAGHASILSSVVNLANTIIGAGALAFPSVMAGMGLIPGILTCLMSGGFTAFGLYLLSRCARQVGIRPGEEGRKASFNEVARLTFGKGWAIRLFDFAIAIKCFGVSISYLIICKTLLPQVCATLSHALNLSIPDHSILLSQDFWLVMTMLVIVPLSFFRTLDSLRFTSQIALSTVVYLIAVVVGWYFLRGPSPSRGPIHLARLGPSALSSFPVQVFAYTCSQNLFPIYNELKDKTQKRMNTVIIISIGSGAACYEVLGIIGYLTFGGKVGSNIIAMYPATSIIIALGRLGIVLLVGLSYPLQCLPARACIHHLTSGLSRRRSKVQPSSESTIAQSVDGPAGTDDGDDEEEEEEDDPLVPKAAATGIKPQREMNRGKFVAITLGILVAGYAIAFAVDELEIVLGFVGSTGSTTISFLLPGLFYFTMFRGEPGATKWAAFALFIYGCFVMVFCLAFNIYHLIGHQGPSGH